MHKRLTVAEFAEEGLPVWAAGARGVYPEFTFDVDSLLALAPSLLCEASELVEREDIDDLTVLMFSAFIDDCAMGAGL